MRRLLLTAALALCRLSTSITLHLDHPMGASQRNGGNYVGLNKAK